MGDGLPQCTEGAVVRTVAADGGADEAAERAGLHVFDDPRGGVENDAVRRCLGGILQGAECSRRRHGVAF